MLLMNRLPGMNPICEGQMPWVRTGLKAWLKTPATISLGQFRRVIGLVSSAEQIASQDPGVDSFLGGEEEGAVIEGVWGQGALSELLPRFVQGIDRNLTCGPPETVGRIVFTGSGIPNTI